MILNVKIPLKTVIFTIGPSGCGKSYFVDQLVAALRKKVEPYPNIKVLSSDAIRRDLIDGHNLHKHAPEMSYASEEAFAVMEHMLRSYTAFPILTDVVILDATFLTKENREKFRLIAKENQYQVIPFIFDYKDRDDYFKYNKRGEHHVISGHLKRFKETTMSEIYKKDFDQVYKIKSIDYELVLEDDPSYVENQKSYLPTFDKYFVIGDVHSCYDEMIELLNKVGFTIEDGILKGNDDTLVILLGDYIDKGPKINEVIDFLLKNRARVKTLIGNHENFVYKFFKGLIPSLPPKDVMDDYFDSTHRLNDEYKQKLMGLIEDSQTYYFHDNFYITHAPCKNKYIGKYDSFSKKNMRNVSYPREKEFPTSEEHIEAVEKHFAYIEPESRKNFPLHVFGHVAVANAFAIKNKVFLDSGCVNGDRLTGAFLYRDSSNIHYHSIVSHQIQKEKSLKIFNKEE